MLCFVGLGINGYAGLSLLASETLKKCQFIYIERFTGYIDDDDIRQLKNLLENGNKSIQIVSRWFIEDVRSSTPRSHDDNVAILTYRDLIMASTSKQIHV